ncbi:MAG TPA: ABC transporter permease [Actinomycetota bacterium]|nr:ABC transporter permease [Actinomycetota bacterium]
MGRYVIRRLAWVVFVLLVITFITYFVFFKLPPGDPATRFAGRQPTPALVHEVEQQFGLDKPFVVQYGLFVKRLFLGDQYGWPGLGISFNTRSPLRAIILQRMAVTVQVALGAALVWIAIGIPIGVLSALKPRSLGDRLAMGFALFGVSAPVFWLGQMFLYVFWFKLGVAAGSGYYAIGKYGFITWANHMIMPWVVLSLLFAANYARMSRGNLIETMSEDYIRTARAKGLTEKRVVVRHGLRSSMTPLVTMIGMDLGTLLGGAIITETVFNLPGLGALVVQSVTNYDFNAILDVTVVAAVVVTVMNLLVDVAYAYLDPRVRYT